MNSIPSAGHPPTQSFERGIQARGTLSVDDVPAAQRTAYWNDFICASSAEIACRMHTDLPLHGQVRFTQFPALTLTELDSSTARVDRTRLHISRSEQSLTAVLMLKRGRMRLEQAGHLTELAAGDAVVYSADSPLALVFEGGSEQALVTFSTEHFRLLGGCCGNQGPDKLRMDTGRVSLLRHFTDLLSSAGGDMDHAAATHLGEGFLHTLAACVSSTTVRPDTPWEQRRAYHLVRAQRYVLDHLSEIDLSAATVGRRIGISVAQLHRVFGAGEDSFSGWLWEQRLVACAKDLQRPLLDHLPVADIGLKWGFKTAAHFSRLFARRFGAPPAHWRNQRRTVS